MGHTLVIELRDEDYAALLAEARRFGVAPEQVAVARLSGVTPEVDREREFRRAGIASGLYAEPTLVAVSARTPFKTQSTSGTPVSQSLIDERR